MTNKELGLQIQHKRKRMNISTKELSDLTGISYVQILRYENGKQNIPSEKLLKIFEILEIDLDILNQ